MSESVQYGVVDTEIYPVSVFVALFQDAEVTLVPVGVDDDVELLTLNVHVMGKVDPL